ncbi:MAG: 2Fe-2S iron-sulfur cluster-binding protein, partial [Pseudomonadota bacterium]
QDLRPGARIDVLPPEGRFVLAQDAGRSLLLVAAGSGITPCLAIAAEALRRPDRQVTLLYGNRSTADVMFKREVEALKDAAPDRFRLIHVLSREAQDVPLLHGRIDRDRIERLCAGGILDAHSIDTAFLCGPGGMISDVTDALTAAGLPAHAIRSERFSTDGARPMQLPPAVAPPAHGAQVEVILDGTRRNLTVDGASDTILSAATEAGLDLPFSCAGGMCCTCRCRVVEGSAAMDVNYALEPWEVEAGFVLACQSLRSDRKARRDARACGDKQKGAPRVFREHEPALRWQNVDPRARAQILCPGRKTPVGHALDPDGQPIRTSGADRVGATRVRSGNVRTQGQVLSGLEGESVSRRVRHREAHRHRVPTGRDDVCNLQSVKPGHA